LTDARRADSSDIWEIDEDDTILRRVQPIWVVPDPKVAGGKRASAAAFEDDSDGSAMSGYARSIVVELRLHDSDVVNGKGSGWAVATAPVSVLVSEDQTVRHDPVLDTPTPHPCDPAHCLVHGVKKPKGRRDRIALASPLVYTVP
jgi:hypothetical protein